MKLDPAALHYSEITIKSTFHHTPRFMREALATIARGEIRASDFITGEVPLAELPQVFEQMKKRNGEMKTAVIPSIAARIADTHVMECRDLPP